MEDSYNLENVLGTLKSIEEFEKFNKIGSVKKLQRRDVNLDEVKDINYPVLLADAKPLTFISWGDVGYKLFDEIPFMFKMQACILLNSESDPMPDYVTFGTISTDVTTEVYDGDNKEVFQYHIESKVWPIRGVRDFYKTIEEAKVALSLEYKKYLISLFNYNYQAT
jgi:hypothetical protein